MGVLNDRLGALAREADLERLMIDSTIVRAQQHAAGNWFNDRSAESGMPRRAHGIRKAAASRLAALHGSGNHGHHWPQDKKRY